MAVSRIVPVGGAQPGGTAPMSFVSAADQSQVAADVVIDWDFDNDGDFSEPIEDITSYVISAETISGRDFPSSLTGEVGAGQLKMTLENSDGRFSFFNADSPLNQDGNSLKTGRKIRVSALTPTIALVLDGTSGGTASTPDAVSLDITGDLDVRIMFSVPDWDNHPTIDLVGKWVTSGDQRSWLLRLLFNNTLELRTSDNGTAANITDYNATVPVPGKNNRWAAVRVTFDASVSEVSFEHSPSNSLDGPWTVLSTDITAPETIFSSTAPLVVGDDSSGGTQVYHSLQVRDGIGGTVVANPNFNIQEAGDTSFNDTATPAKTWTVNGSASIEPYALVDTTPDPTLIARDRFNRAAGPGPLGVTETGQTWVAQVDGFVVFQGGVAQAKDVTGTRLFHTIDVNTNDYYAQVTVRQLPFSDASSRTGGLVVRWTDSSNHVMVRYDLISSAPVIQILQRNGGADSTLATGSIRAWEGMTIGAEVSGSTVTAYVGGVPVASATTAETTGTHVGLHCFYSDNTGRAPEFDDFYVWDRVPAEIDGALWTGFISDVTPSVRAGPVKLAQVTAEGIFANAARAKVAAPRLPYRGEATGLIVGDIMSRAGLLHPPGPTMQAGTVTTGAIGIGDDNALSLARNFEKIERGFLHETNEGYVGYHGRDARDTASSMVWFTDTPGRGQHLYSEIAPVDHKGQIINEVTAGVAGDPPAGITRINPSPSGNTTVTVPMPTTTNPGDFLVVFIANSMQTNGEQWLVPQWWTEHRNLGDSFGVRVYSKPCDGTEGGTSVMFYANTGTAAGLWVAEVYRIENWYESYNNGIAMSAVARGGDPHALVHGWGRHPTLFIAVRSGLGALSPGISFSASVDPPDGYKAITGNVISSGTFALDAGIASAIKIDCTESEDPNELRGLTGAITDESLVFAIRGYNGPHTKATLENPRTTGGDGRFVTRSDTDSQDDHNLIRSHETPALFRSESDAEGYCNAVLTEFADDRPIVRISFNATKNLELRNQARMRRVGDKITVTATGDSSLGIERDFFIENISHRFDFGTRVWDTTWELSPG